MADYAASPAAIDDVEPCRAAADGLCRQASIEGRQLALVDDGQGEEIGIRDLIRRRDLVDIDKIGVHQAEIILSENMAGEGAQARRRPGSRRNWDISDDRRSGGRHSL